MKKTASNAVRFAFCNMVENGDSTRPKVPVKTWIKIAACGDQFSI